MTDIVSPQMRSRMMSAVRGCDTGPEMVVRRALHRAGLRFRLGGGKLSGRPDIVLSSRRTVIFVHGCFWHQHPGCSKATRPKSNVAFWNAKLDANLQRDARVQAALRGAGWKIFIVWRCQINARSIAQLTQQIMDLPTPNDTVLRIQRATEKVAGLKRLRSLTTAHADGGFSRRTSHQVGAKAPQ
jgi:DNA mismatch endonuclease (patch repair protein)